MNYTCTKKPYRLLDRTALILLIVTIGLLNVCLGFGLAMFFGYGPPGLSGVFEAMGPMPPASPLASSRLGSPYDPETLAEESLLGDVRDMASDAETAMISGPVESRE